jgi:hypothetical protein
MSSEKQTSLIKTEYTYGKSGDENVYHFLQVPGETIEFCETENDAQGQVNYHYYVLGVSVGYMETNSVPSNYMWSNPIGINFILFDKETSVIVKPVPKEKIQTWTDSIRDDSI